jgi:hypothetical protein
VLELPTHFCPKVEAVLELPKTTTHWLAACLAQLLLLLLLLLLL